jgi:geranylgeranyl diphosphate synthase type II
MVELKTSWYSFITPNYRPARSRPAPDERLAPLGARPAPRAAFQITDDLLNLRADPEEYGKRDRRRPLGGQADLMLLPCGVCREAGSRRADPGQAPPERRRRVGLTELLDRLPPGPTVPVGRAEIAARLGGHHPSESEEPQRRVDGYN